jgi:hypothetical protein
MVPKFQFSLMNQEFALHLDSRPAPAVGRSAGRQPGDPQPPLKMLEKMNEEVDQDTDRDIKNLTILNQRTLRMSHLKSAGDNDLTYRITIIK